MRAKVPSSVARMHCIFAPALQKSLPLDTSQCDEICGQISTCHTVTTMFFFKCNFYGAVCKNLPLVVNPYSQQNMGQHFTRGTTRYCQLSLQLAS